MGADGGGGGLLGSLPPMRLPASGAGLMGAPPGLPASANAAMAAVSAAAAAAAAAGTADPLLRALSPVCAAAVRGGLISVERVHQCWAHFYSYYRGYEVPDEAAIRSAVVAGAPGDVQQLALLDLDPDLDPGPAAASV